MHSPRHNRHVKYTCILTHLWMYASVAKSWSDVALFLCILHLRCQNETDTSTWSSHVTWALISYLKKEKRSQNEFQVWVQGQWLEFKMPTVNGAQELKNLCLCHAWCHRLTCWNLVSSILDIVTSFKNGCLKILLAVVYEGKHKSCYLIASCSLPANCILRVCDSINNKHSNATSSVGVMVHTVHFRYPQHTSTPCPFVGRTHRSWCGH